MIRTTHHIGVVQIEENIYNCAFEEDDTIREELKTLHSNAANILFIIDYDDFIKIQNIQHIAVDIYNTHLRNIAANVVNIKKIKGRKNRYAIELSIDKKYNNDLKNGQQAYISIYYSKNYEKELKTA